MTQAACIKCGEFKFGALVPCDHCHFQPQTPKELAHSLAVTDQHQTPESLKKFSDAAKAAKAAGRELQITLPPEQEAELLFCIEKLGVSRILHGASALREEDSAPRVQRKSSLRIRWFDRFFSGK